MWLLLTACADRRPPPIVNTTERWDAVLALAETACDEWPEEDFATGLGPTQRREALRAWHAADPAAVTEVDTRYVSFAYVDRTDPEDVAVLAHLVANLRACGRWVDQRAEEELILRACDADAERTRAAVAALAPRPHPKVYAAREAVWMVDLELPSVEGRFMSALLVGAQEWMAKWVLDGEGVVPEMPSNMPFGQLLREETRPPEPGVPEMVARCTAAPNQGGAPPGPFRVPQARAAGVLRADPAGLRLWWPDDGVLGAAGPLGPLSWWVGAERRGTLDVGELTRVEHCAGQHHWEAVIPLGEGGPPDALADGVAVALPPHATQNDWRLEAGSCGEALVGPVSSVPLGCCR